MTTRIGIIGCGRIAHSHVQGYKAHGAQVTALMDTDPAAAERLAEEVDGAVYFDSIYDLFESGLVDAVSVCTPPTAHEEPVVAALEHGIHVLCEKPLAHTIEAGRRMVEAAEREGALLMTAFPHRFRPSSQKMREIIASGRLGRLVFFDCRLAGWVPWVRDAWYTRKEVAAAGVLLDICAHCVDVCRFLVGEMIEQRAVIAQHMEGTEVEDVALMALKSRDGALGTVSASWVAGAPQHYIRIVGENGSLVYEYAQPARLQLEIREPKAHEVIEVATGDGFKEETGHFLAAVRGETPLACSGRDGLRTLEIILPLYDEARV